MTAHDQTTLPNLMATDQTDNRLGDDVPPVPRIPSSLNLPGTFPRDISPARGVVNTERTQLEPKTSSPERKGEGRKRNGDGVGSLSVSGRRGRDSRPGSRREAGAETRGIELLGFGKGKGTGTGKIDFREFLMGITTQSDGAEGESLKVLSGEKVGGVRPPY